MTEPAGTRLARLLTLVPWLTAHDGVTIDQTAEHFGISPQDLERDLWLLVVSGLPGHGPDQLVDIDFWDDGVIRVIDPQTLARPLRLTHEEAITLLVALRTLAQLPGVEDRAAILGAMAKLESFLADDAAASLPDVALAADPTVVGVIDEAIRTNRGLQLTYASATRGEVTDRVVAPMEVRIVDAVGYLEAWCALSEGVRSFRLDRILAAHPAERPDVPPSLAPVPTPPIAALIAVRAEDRWVTDVIDGVAVAGTDDSGRTLLRVPLLSLDWGATLVMSLSEGTAAVEPVELVRSVAERAAAAAAAYPDHVG